MSWQQWSHPKPEDFSEPYFGGGDWRVYVSDSVLFVRHGTQDEIRRTGDTDRCIPVPDDVRAIVEHMKADPFFRPLPEPPLET